jgi:hypothetical protein
MQKEMNRVGQKDILNLDISKKIAGRKMELEKKLIQEISKDIKSDLI